MRLRVSPVAFVVLVIAGMASACGDDEPAEATVSSLSYQGHENDADANNLVRAYPALVGTRLDDCQTCHASGTVLYPGQRSADLNPCSYCHLIPYPDTTIVSGAPDGFAATLNPFGADYQAHGRSRTAILDVADIDSDQDGHANEAELAAGRYPGDPASQPGQQLAPARVVTWEEMRALATHEQLLLLNSHRQLFDDYCHYRGARMKDIVAAFCADTAATSITIIAPDGYMKDFDLSVVDQPFPAGLYYDHLDAGSFADPDQGFVNYPPAQFIPEELTHGREIPGEQWMILALRRDGLDLEEAYLDHLSGKLNGEGPYRVVVPQSRPGAPDRGSSFPTDHNDGWDYDSGKDHNAGLCVRGVVAIRINPLPAGYEEFDWKNGGWALIEKRQLLVYGAGVTEE